MLTSAAQFKLAWDPSPDSRVSAYRIYYGAASGSYTNNVLVNNATTCTLPGLEDGITYYFAATALTTNGLESAYSIEVSGIAGLLNQPPALDPIADLTINENAGLQTVTLTGVGSGAIGENQTLTVTATSTNPTLIPPPTVNYSSPSVTGALTFLPVGFAFGSAIITVIVNDGAATNNLVSRSFIVTVAPVNQIPTISSFASVIIAVDRSTPPLPFTISDIEAPAASLILSGTSDNLSLVKPSAIVFGGTGTSRTVTITPVSGQTGNANITVAVSDGSASANSIVPLTVRAKPLPPGSVRVKKN